MLSDADTLAGRQISDGAAIHLFQRPKVAAAAAAGVGTASAQQPGNLREFPPVLLHFQERGGDGEGAHGEVDVPRRKIMFLASLLLLISVLQVLPSFFCRGDNDQNTALSSVLVVLQVFLLEDR